MQKLLFVLFCLVLPTAYLNDFSPIVKFAVVYEGKLVIALFLFYFTAGFWSVVSFFKFLLRGFQLKHFVELIISFAICWVAFCGVKYRIRNFHKRPIRILRSEFPPISDLRRSANDLAQAKNNIILIIQEIPKLVALIRRTIDYKVPSNI